jgi:hypothetical protein
VPPGAVVEIAGNPHYQARVPHTFQIAFTRTDSLRLHPQGPAGDVVLTSSIDRYVVEREPEIARVWLAALEDSSAAGHYRMIVFRRRDRGVSWNVEIPTVTAYVKRSLTAAEPTR